MKEQLFGRIDPEVSRYDIRATQLALKLKKADPAHWTTLEKSSQAAPSAPSASQVWPVPALLRALFFFCSATLRITDTALQTKFEAIHALVPSQIVPLPIFPCFPSKQE